MRSQGNDLNDWLKTNGLDDFAGIIKARLQNEGSEPLLKAIPALEAETKPLASRAKRSCQASLCLSCCLCCQPQAQKRRRANDAGDFVDSDDNGSEWSAKDLRRPAFTCDPFYYVPSKAKARRWLALFLGSFFMLIFMPWLAVTVAIRLILHGRNLSVSELLGGFAIFSCCSLSIAATFGYLMNWDDAAAPKHAVRPQPAKLNGKKSVKGKAGNATRKGGFKGRAQRRAEKKKKREKLALAKAARKAKRRTAAEWQAKYPSARKGAASMGFLLGGKLPARGWFEEEEAWCEAVAACVWEKVLKFEAFMGHLPLELFEEAERVRLRSGSSTASPTARQRLNALGLVGLGPVNRAAVLNLTAKMRWGGSTSSEEFYQAYDEVVEMHSLEPFMVRPQPKPPEKRLTYPPGWRPGMSLEPIHMQALANLSPAPCRMENTFWPLPPLSIRGHGGSKPRSLTLDQPPLGLSLDGPKSPVEVPKANSFGLAVAQGKGGASKDFFNFQSVFEPLCAETPEGEKLREEGFLEADPNGNGLCSLAELETFVLKYLVVKFPRHGKGYDIEEPGKDLFKAFRPSYMRAFTDAKDFKADTGEVVEGTKNATDDDFVSWEEFRLFCVYLIVYAAMFDAFAKIDGGGAGRDAGDDLRIELREWLIGYKKIIRYGFVRAKSLEGISKKEAQNIFETQIDDNGGGIVLLDEWCEWLKRGEVDSNTAVGQLLNMDEEGGVGENFQLTGPAQVLGKGVKGKQNVANMIKKSPQPLVKKKMFPRFWVGCLRETKQVIPSVKANSGPTRPPKPPPKLPPPAVPNSFGLAVGRGKTGASAEFFKYQSVFEPMCAETREGVELREDGFIAADPNGNGLCSLAELETFVLKYLTSKYPRSGRGDGVQEPGKDLFRYFRPCYMRAFNDAKDYADDSGEIIEGTKDATDDDFVSWPEFRIFCVYLIVYGAMYDAFAKVDGGGMSRGAGKDLRIEMKEWLAGYTSVTRHGFVRLAALADLPKKGAKKIFQCEIDDNGGGIVLLDEWCEWLKQGEIEAATPIGELLNASENGRKASNEDYAAQEARSIAIQEERNRVDYAARLNIAKRFEASERLALDREQAHAQKIRDFVKIVDEENSRYDSAWKREGRGAAPERRAQHQIDSAARAKKLKKLRDDLRDAEFKVQWKAEEYQRALGMLSRARKPINVVKVPAHKQADKAKERARKFAKQIRKQKAARAEYLSEFRRRDEAREWAQRNNVGVVAVSADDASDFEGDPLSPGPSEGLEKFSAPFKMYAADSTEGEALRSKDFKVYAGANGLMSLAKMEGFILATLLQTYPKTEKGSPEVGHDLFDAYRPAYLRAFNDAKDFLADDGEVIAGAKTANADDYVTKEEFQIFNCMLLAYAAMYDAFSKIDGGGSGRAGDDRKIDPKEWRHGYLGATGYGFIAFEDLTDRASAKAMFDQMDDNGGGVVDLREFCSFIKEAEVAAGTDMGKVLAAQEDDSAAAFRLARKKTKTAPSFDVPPNSFGLAVGRGKWGASKEFFDFQAVFEPLCAETPEAEEMRKEGFIAADPNGNGLCSLAELETFVLKYLVAKYPKSGKGKDLMEPGKDLFTAFRPCYMRAFADAKDYKADTGEVIAGTKDATNDDFVSFLFFCTIKRKAFDMNSITCYFESLNLLSNFNRSLGKSSACFASTLSCMQQCTMPSPRLMVVDRVEMQTTISE